MPSSIAVLYSTTQIATQTMSRVMVAVPLLYIYMTHYIFQLLCMMKGTEPQKIRMRDLGKRLYLFGFAAVLTLNFLEVSPLGALCAWLLLITTIVTHCFVFLKETGQKYHNYSLLVYYSILFIWYSIISYMYIYNALT